MGNKPSDDLFVVLAFGMIFGVLISIMRTLWAIEGLLNG